MVLAPDLYAFSDESSSTPAIIFTQIYLVISSISDFNSITSPPTTPGTQMGGSLTREVDLKPQFSDLDNLFESDSDSNDDAVSEYYVFSLNSFFCLIVKQVLTTYLNYSKFTLESASWNQLALDAI